MDVGIVGSGRVATAIAVLLRRAGHRIAAVSGRGNTQERATRWLEDVPFVAAEEAARSGELVVIGVPDDAIDDVVGTLAANSAFREGAWVAHLSGASGLGALTRAQQAGARRLAVHPLMTVPDVASAIERIRGCTMAVTADDEQGTALGERLARDVGAVPFRLANDDRPLYHAAAVFASNYLIASVATAEDLLRRVGGPDATAALLPLERASLDNVERLGAGDALTGPAIRGDAGTVEANLRALATAAPETVPAYVAMCRLALGLGARAGRSSSDARRAIEDVLARWT